MSKYKEMLCCLYAKESSERAIARSLQVKRDTVKKTKECAQKNGLIWKETKNMEMKLSKFYFLRKKKYKLFIMF